MTILNADYIITMPDDSKWKIPVRVIAMNRAEWCLNDNPTEFASITLAMRDTAEYFESDWDAIEDWARSNMSWSEVEQHATCVESSKIDYEDGWSNGDVVIDPEDRDGV